MSPHPGHHVLHDGYTVLVTRPDGGFDGTGREGLYDFDCRILSRYALTIGGERPTHVGSELDGADRWRTHLLAPLRGGVPDGPRLPQDLLELTLSRQICDGMLERLAVRNHSMAPAEVDLVLELGADFADVLDLGDAARGRGTVSSSWDPAARALRFIYRAEANGRKVERGLRVRVGSPGLAPDGDGRGLRFRIALAPAAEWIAVLVYGSLVDGVWREPSADAVQRRTTLRRRWHAHRTALEPGGPVLAAAFERAGEDLIALRNWAYDVSDDAWVPNAGVPTYTGLFGRDTLAAGWQAAMLGPEPMRGALARLAEYQATDDSGWRDEEPGKLLHERRRGPLAELDLVPQRAYYGEQTAPAMFVIALSEYWHWTGDTAALERYRDTALRAFAWADRYGDRDGDGLLEYDTRSPAGLKNQGWKDSNEAIRYPDGSQVENPIATIEEQGYHFLALQRMAELLFALGDDDGAERFLQRAGALGRSVNRAFWLERERYYALALDREKRPVATIASNAGHALATGIIPPDRAADVARRLLAPDLFSGWGVRTLSSAHPSYNPYAYHLGTVWPVENATFALGFKRYGLDDAVERVAGAMLDAAAHFEALRLPEALGGHAREQMSVPTFYPASNSPQAWSASAVVLLVQALLGLYPFAPANLLLVVRPRLPAGVQAVTVRRLRVGDAVVSLRFRRQEDGSATHEVLERAGTVHVVSAPPPADLASDLESLPERLEAWGVRRAPGRTARLFRIALGLEG
ncbi:MAG TPA: glycogen debranching N-terminal domain-containing protein [Gemmatimonadales bacterium]